MDQNRPLRDVLASLVRTAVPYGVGLVLAWLARKYDIIIDENSAAGLSATLAVIAGSVYYVLIRALESRFPGFGWFLGLAIPPTYPKPIESPGADPDTRVIRTPPPTL